MSYLVYHPRCLQHEFPRWERCALPHETLTKLGEHESLWLTWRNINRYSASPLPPDSIILYWNSARVVPAMNYEFNESMDHLVMMLSKQHQHRIQFGKLSPCFSGHYPRADVVYFGQPMQYRGTDGSQAHPQHKMQDLHQCVVNGGRSLLLVPGDTQEPDAMSWHTSVAEESAFLTYAWVLEEALKESSCVWGQDLKMHINGSLLSSYQDHHLPQGFGCQLQPSLFFVKDSPELAAIAWMKQPTLRHITCKPYHDQGLANRLCTIANCMMLASWFRCGLAIIWVSSPHCPCEYHEVLKIHCLQTGHIPFITWSRNDEEYSNNIEGSISMFEFSSYSRVDAYSLKFHGLQKKYYLDKNQAVRWLPLNNHLRRLCEVLKIKGSRDAVLRMEQIRSQYLDNKWATGLVGIHVRRSDMKSTLEHHGTHRKWNDEDENLRIRIQEALHAYKLVWIATDDGDYYRQIRQWFPHACESEQLLFNPAYLQCFQTTDEDATMLPRYGAALRQTPMQVFLDDLYYLSQCDEIQACRYSTVSFLLKEIADPAYQLFKSLGVMCPKSFKIVPARAQQQLESFMEMEGYRFLNQLGCCVPGFALSEAHIDILNSIPAAMIEILYTEITNNWFFKTIDGNRSIIPSSVLGNLTSMTALRPYKEQFERINDLLDAQKKHTWVKRTCSFQMALMWTKVFEWATARRQRAFVVFGHYVVSVPDTQAAKCPLYYIWLVMVDRQKSWDQQRDWGKSHEVLEVVEGLVDNSKPIWQRFLEYVSDPFKLPMLLSHTDYVCMSSHEKNDVDHRAAAWAKLEKQFEAEEDWEWDSHYAVSPWESWT